MNLELSTLKDGGILLVSDDSIPDMVKRIEFFRDQQMMTLVYKDEALQSDLLEYEVPGDMVDAVEKSPDVMVYVLFKDHEPVGYKVPLIKVGAIY